MLKELFALWICTLAAVRLSHAAVYRLPPQPKPTELAHQRGCYFPELHIVLPYNKPYYPRDGSCRRYTCRTNGETEIFTCGAISTVKGCDVVAGDLTRAYPKCCHAIRCP